MWSAFRKGEKIMQIMIAIIGICAAAMLLWYVIYFDEGS